jgi:hypothetical protein
MPADQSTAKSTPRLRVPTPILRSPRRRRPTGEPPPLPYHLQTSGIGWLVTAVVLVGLVLAVFARGLRGPAVAVTVIDDAVVRWLAGLYRPLWLMAQSVPSATLVPCRRARLAGWVLAEVAVNDGRSITTLDHDRAGTGVVEARLTAACDTTGAVEVPAAEPGVRAYKQIEQLSGEYTATWYDRFPGGCVTYRLHSMPDLQGGFASEVPLLFGFTSRQVLRQALYERSGGRLHLDAGRAP